MECQFVTQENARRHENLYPMAAETVLKSTYMDDFIVSVETEEGGIELYRQLDALWSLAGMHARKWIWNSPKVIAATPEEDRATQFNVSDGQGPVIRMVFDPLVLVSPFVVTAKILLQELWTRGYDWDDVILDEIGDKIMRWFACSENTRVFAADSKSPDEKDRHLRRRVHPGTRSGRLLVVRIRR